VLTSGSLQWPVGPFSKVFPWIKPLVTPLNTRGTGAAQKTLIQIFIHKSFWEKRFHGPIWFQWKAITREVTRQSFVTRVTPENLLVTHDISSTTATFSSLAFVYALADNSYLLTKEMTLTIQTWQRSQEDWRQITEPMLITLLWTWHLNKLCFS